MSDTYIDPNALLASSGGGKAFKFENIGDKVSGEVLAVRAEQERIFGTEELAFTRKGKPKMVLIVTLQTGLIDPTDPDDDGARNLYLKGWNFVETSGIGAVAKALTEAKATGIEIGGTLAVAFTGLGEAPQPGFAQPKQYAAKDKAPAAPVDLGGILDSF
jgi:hypothetical protein